MEGVLVSRGRTGRRLRAAWSLALLCALAFLSTGWTWSVEGDNSGLTVKHERRNSVDYPAVGTAYRLCDSNELARGTFDQCIGGDLDDDKGRIALDLGSLPIDVQSWCVRIGGGEADCIAIRDLSHVIAAHDARRLSDARQYHEAAEQYRLAARRAGDLVRPDGTSLKEDYTRSATAADRRPKAVDRQTRARRVGWPEIS